MSSSAATAVVGLGAFYKSCIKPEYASNFAMMEEEVWPFRDTPGLLTWEIRSLVWSEGSKSQSAPAMDSHDHPDKESEFAEMSDQEADNDEQRDSSNESESSVAIFSHSKPHNHSPSIVWTPVMVHDASKDTWFESKKSFDTRAQAEQSTLPILLKRLDVAMDRGRGSWMPRPADRWTTRVNKTRETVPCLRPEFRSNYAIVKEELNYVDNGEFSGDFQFFESQLVVSPLQADDPVWAHLQPVLDIMRVDAGRERIPKELIDLIYQLQRDDQESSSTAEHDFVTTISLDEEDEENEEEPQAGAMSDDDGPDDDRRPEAMDAEYEAHSSKMRAGYGGQSFQF